MKLDSEGVFFHSRENIVERHGIPVLDNNEYSAYFDTDNL